MKFQLDFTAKRVLVTCGTTGIGLSAAEAFHALGASVAVNGRSAEGVRAAIARLGGGQRLIAAPGDVASAPQRQEVVAAALAAMGGLDILVNNVDRGADAPLDQVSDEYWQQMTDLNLKAVFFTTQRCLPALKASKGVVINVASVAGVIGLRPGAAVQAATEGGVVHMTRMLSLALAKEGVRVNALCPGWIDTPMLRGDGEAIGGAALIDHVSDSVPMGRIGTVDECAGAVLYLAAPFASYTTGAILAVDGGLSAGH